MSRILQDHFLRRGPKEYLGQRGVGNLRQGQLEHPVGSERVSYLCPAKESSVRAIFQMKNRN